MVVAQRKTDRKNRQGEQTRERILEETMRLAARHGYEGTRISMVRKATGLSASSIYWHFSDKEQLIAAALEYAIGAHLRVIPTWPEFASGDDRSADLYKQIFQWPREDFWRFGLQMAVVRPSEDAPTRDRFLEIRRESIDWLARWWEPGLPGHMEQRAVGALMLGNLTFAVRDSYFLRRHAGRRFDEDRIVWLLALSLEAMADRLAELAAGRPIAYEGAPVQAVERTGTESGRQAFLQAAEEIIAEFGYDGVTVARVCERAALPASSLYWFFKDKDDLVAEVVAGAAEKWEAVQPVLSGRSGKENIHWTVPLRSQLRDVLAGTSAGTGILRLGLLLLLRDSNRALGGVQGLEAVMENMQSTTAEWFSTVLPDTGTGAYGAELAEHLSECLFRFLEGLLLSRQIDARTWEPELLADLLATGLHRAAEQVLAGSVPPPRS
ncbi:TetR/AcrR family transcriptional regulator [Arthrobacter sp. ATA002]|uniref:TetR/AcrR family transcriptional regulator n=1 Tax=Arthrobacter sp. ATA002 TaxID=2991715 RepID=UPI0022A7203E|nr:TetR/AcrR family transcriptional regulator [Arthrobacter sp. ATA002]WAP51326.1 TetR/AcrR family transcriptional regulator [Arthrobacter sp. ATA002]